MAETEFTKPVLGLLIQTVFADQKPPPPPNHSKTLGQKGVALFLVVLLYYRLATLGHQGK